MATNNHITILKQGTKVWNKWRKGNSRITPNLVGASLKGVDLFEADLRQANLSKADLAAANLIGADLRGANLSETNLRGTLLIKTNFVGANLSGAVLIESILPGANFRDARFSYTTLANVDLSEVVGLEFIAHGGPSYISIETLYQSGGKMPKVFLLGCGLPDEMIALVKSLTRRPLKFYSCFISYSSKDHAFAERFHSDLRGKGVRVWFAPENLNIGDKFRTRIEEAIQMYDRLLLVLSMNSIHSSWVEKEVESAFEKEKKENRVVLFPIRLDATVMQTQQTWAADIRRTRQIGDMSGWKDPAKYRKAFARLMRDLQSSDLK